MPGKNGQIRRASHQFGLAVKPKPPHAASPVDRKLFTRRNFTVQCRLRRWQFGSIPPGHAITVFANRKPCHGNVR